MMQAEKELLNEELHGDLGRAFNFTLEDLEANRAGLVSERQKKLRKRQFDWSFRATFLVILLLANILIYISTGFWGSAENPSSLRLISSASFCLISCLLAAVFFEGIRYLGNLNDWSKDMRLEKITGQVTEVNPESGLITIGNKALKMPHEFFYPWGSLVYNAYYLPRTGEILSVEAIDFEER